MPGHPFWCPGPRATSGWEGGTQRRLVLPGSGNRRKRVRAKGGIAARSYTLRARAGRLGREGDEVVFKRPPRLPPEVHFFPLVPVSVEAPHPHPRVGRGRC